MFYIIIKGLLGSGVVVITLILLLNEIRVYKNRSQDSENEFISRKRLIRRTIGAIMLIIIVILIYITSLLPKLNKSIITLSIIYGICLFLSLSLFVIVLLDLREISFHLGKHKKEITKDTAKKLSSFFMREKDKK
jgi:uncharacterized membrane protein